MINIQKLSKELQAVNYPLGGVCVFDNEQNKKVYGLADWFTKDYKFIRIDITRETTDEEKLSALTVINNHTPYDYVAERLKVYPPLGDQIDHLYKALKEFKEQGTWDGIDEWFAKIEKVKTDFPKQ